MKEKIDEQNLDLNKKIKLIQDNKVKMNALKTELMKVSEAVAKKSRTYINYNAKNKWTAFDMWVNNFSRNVLFHKVKFITSQAQLDSYEEKGTLGYELLEKYKKDYAPNDEEYETLDLGRIWNNAKNRVLSSINRRRGDFSNLVKKNFKVRSKLYFVHW